MRKGKGSEKLLGKLDEKELAALHVFLSSSYLTIDKICQMMILNRIDPRDKVISKMGSEIATINQIDVYPRIIGKVHGLLSDAEIRELQMMVYRRPKIGYQYSIQCCSDKWIEVFMNMESFCPICNSTFIARANL